MEKINFTIALERGAGKAAWGVVVPDLPGCFSAGDTLNEALANAREAIVTWVNAVIEDGGKLPAVKDIDEWVTDPEFAGWTWAVIPINPLDLDSTLERVNISLPRNVLARIDALAEARGDNRSKTIARLALERNVESSGGA